MVKKVEHYLITLPVNPAAGGLHCYLMTNDKAQLQAASNKLLDLAEELNAPVLVPMIFCTGPLTPKTVEAVRRVLKETSKNKTSTDPVTGERNSLEDVLAAATDFHMSIFGLLGSDPAHAELMKIH